MRTRGVSTGLSSRTFGRQGGERERDETRLIKWSKRMQPDSCSSKSKQKLDGYFSL